MTGPAQTSESLYGISLDSVHSIVFEIGNILSTWLEGQRKNAWPPTTVRQTITEIHGNLVATGLHGSEREHLEWRLCFNEIEPVFMENLNDTQLKLYKMLTCIKNDILIPQFWNHVLSWVIARLCNEVAVPSETRCQAE